MATKKPATAKTETVQAAQTPTPNLDLLAAIVTATNGAAGFMNANAEQAQALAALGYVEVNPDPQYATADGPAVRATAAGAAAASARQPVANAVSPFASPGLPGSGTAAPATTVNAQPANANPTPANPVGQPNEKPTFAIVSFTLPEAVRAAGGGLGPRPETYPFSKLEVGQAFFIPATAEKPNPAKSYASTVASATERYAEADTTQPQVANRKGAMVHPKKYERKFAIRPIADGKEFGAAYAGKAGAAVGRIA